MKFCHRWPLTLSNAIDDGLCLAGMTSKLLFSDTIKSMPIEIYTDGKFLYHAINSNEIVSRKSLRIDIATLGVIQVKIHQRYSPYYNWRTNS